MPCLPIDGLAERKPSRLGDDAKGSHTYHSTEQYGVTRHLMHLRRLSADFPHVAHRDLSGKGICGALMFTGSIWIMGLVQEVSDVANEGDRKCIVYFTLL